MFIFSNERSFFAFFIPLTCLDHIPFRLLLLGLSRYKVYCKSQSSSMTCSRDIQGNRLCSSLMGYCDWIRWQDRMQHGVAGQSKRVINSTNEVSNPVKWDHMLAKGGLGMHDPTSWTRFVLVYTSNTEHVRATFWATLYYMARNAAVDKFSGCLPLRLKLQTKHVRPLFSARSKDDEKGMGLSF